MFGGVLGGYRSFSPMTHERTGSERRLNPRRQVRLTMVIGGQTTHTVDVSTSGIRFETVSALLPGEPIAFSLQITSAGQELRVDCEGRVVRVDATREGSRAAATIETMKFEHAG